MPKSGDMERCGHDYVDIDEGNVLIQLTVIIDHIIY